MLRGQGWMNGVTDAMAMMGVARRRLALGRMGWRVGLGAGKAPACCGGSRCRQGLRPLPGGSLAAAGAAEGGRRKAAGGRWRGEGAVRSGYSKMRAAQARPAATAAAAAGGSGGPGRGRVPRIDRAGPGPALPRWRGSNVGALLLRRQRCASVVGGTAGARRGEGAARIGGPSRERPERPAARVPTLFTVTSRSRA